MRRQRHLRDGWAAPRSHGESKGKGLAYRRSESAGGDTNLSTLHMGAEWRPDSLQGTRLRKRKKRKQFLCVKIKNKKESCHIIFIIGMRRRCGSCAATVWGSVAGARRPHEGSCQLCAGHAGLRVGNFVAARDSLTGALEAWTQGEALLETKKSRNACLGRVFVASAAATLPPRTGFLPAKPPTKPLRMPMRGIWGLADGVNRGPCGPANMHFSIFCAPLRPALAAGRAGKR